MSFFKVVAPIGKILGLMALVKVFTTIELEVSLTEVSFEIDNKWQPGKKTVFIVAKKAE